METKIYRLSTRAPRGFRHLPILSMTLAAIAALVAGAASSADAPAASAHRSSVAHIRAVTAKVDANMIRANAASTKDWPTYGLNYAETRFSNLRQITDANVKNLGLVWSYDLESTRGVEVLRARSCRGLLSCCPEYFNFDVDC